jgi:hypothetical protein
LGSNIIAKKKHLISLGSLYCLQIILYKQASLHLQPQLELITS